LNAISGICCNFALLTAKHAFSYSIKMSYDEFWQSLQKRYDKGEARAVARYVLETAFGFSLTDIVCGAVEQLSNKDQHRLRNIQQRLLNGEPVQYVVGVADFGPRQFQVAPGVLIPRPETYELCQWIISNAGKHTLHILDIGTGSGCIACTLASEIPQSNVEAWDISERALEIAGNNAKRSNVHVSFKQVDALHLTAEILQQKSNAIDIIVSNPPYICNKEASFMEPHVLEHEPHLALFVPDNDPLLFYRSIAHFAQQSLVPGGCLYFEINPLYLDQMLFMLNQTGFVQIEHRIDQFGKPRFIKAQKK
jgi:release factor glutamine methyltransferase